MMTAEQFKKLRKSKKSKYKSVRCEVDSIKFPSLSEMRYYEKLKDMQYQKEILYFLRQVPLHLVGNTKYVADFLVFHLDGSVEYIDVKGMETPTFKLKKKQVEATYPIKINVVTR